MRLQMRHIALVASVAVLAGTVVVQRAGGDPPEAAYSLESARSFGQYPVYYAGRNVLGLPLTTVLRQPVDNVEPRDTRSDTVSFVYGTCVPVDETGCAPPLEIQNWPACVRNRARYRGQGVFGPRVVDTTVRGAPAAFLEGGARIEIQTGKATVVIFGRSKAQVLTVVNALRGVNTPVRSTDLLPRPARGAVEGTLAC